MARFFSPDLRWRDIPAMLPLLGPALSYPISFLAVAAEHIKPNVKTEPYLALLADKMPPVPLIEVWAWAYLSASSANTDKRRAAILTAIKRSEKTGQRVEPVLYGLLSLVVEGYPLWDIRAVGDEPTREARVNRREAFAADVRGARDRGVSLPALSVFDVDEVVFYAMQDVAKAAMREITET